MAPNLDWNEHQALKNVNAAMGLLEKYGNAIFHDIMWYGSPKVIQLFLDNGADLTAQDENGMNALHIAACSRSLEVICLVAGRGHVTVQDYRGKTPLDYFNDRNFGSKRIAAFNLNEHMQPIESPLRNITGADLHEIIETGTFQEIQRTFAKDHWFGNFRHVITSFRRNDSRIIEEVVSNVYPNGNKYFVDDARNHMTRTNPQELNQRILGYAMAYRPKN